MVHGSPESIYISLTGKISFIWSFVFFPPEPYKALKRAFAHYLIYLSVMFQVDKAHMLLLVLQSGKSKAHEVKRLATGNFANVCQDSTTAGKL